MEFDVSGEGREGWEGGRMRPQAEPDPNWRCLGERVGGIRRVAETE